MDQPIEIVVYMQVATGQIAKAEATADAIATAAAAAAAAADGVSLTRSWVPDGTTLALSYAAATQADVDRHLADRGASYQGFVGVGAVVRVTVSGPVDDATVAVFKRLGGAVEMR